MSNSTKQYSLLLIISFVFCGFGLHAQNPFVTKWKTNNPGNTDDFSIRFSVDDESYYDFEIGWGDGSVETYTGLGSDLLVQHTYADSGIYTISVSGDYPRIRFSGSGGDSKKIIEILHWGDIAWSSFGGAFIGCENLAMVAEDVPDLSGVSDLSSMFWGVDSINPSIANWDVSTITNMENMFTAASSFNQPIGNWDVSNVTDMSCMFCANQLFNQPLNAWDVSNVTDMNGMFGSAFSFNQPLDQWDVSSVTEMFTMFQAAHAFDQPIGNWDVSNVVSMNQMFWNAESFNQPIGAWDVSNVESMSGMFWNAPAFNQPLNAWDISSVENNGLSSMFRNATSFNQPLDQWDVSGISTMKNMFSGAESFDQSLENWDVSSVEDFTGMLDNCAMNACYYSNALEGWFNVSPQPDLTLGAEGLSYTEDGEIYRQALIDDFSWSFDGDALTTLPELTMNTNVNGAEISVEGVSGGSGIYTFLWSGPNGFTSSDSVITATENGIYTVVVSDGCEVLEETFEILSVGMESERLESLVVFPNPTAEILNISFTYPADNALLRIHNISGQLVEEFQLSGTQHQIHVSGLRPGVYHGNVRNAASTVLEQFRFVKVD